MTETLLDRTDLCVKCGLCLPHCPTYTQTRNEADGPRGRIALMAALDTGAIGASDQMQSHLDGCLSCRACEAVCPAFVPYGPMMDDARAELAQQVPGRTRLDRWMGAALIPAGRRAALRWALWLLQAIGLVRLGRVLFKRTRLARLASLLPPLRRPRTIGSAKASAKRGHVALFTGCVSSLVDQQSLADSVTVLAALGYDVTVPRDQTCCGALAAHAGLPDKARPLEQINHQAFEGPFDAVLGTASGCTAQLMETVSAAMPPVHNIDAWLAEQPWPDDLPLDTTPLRVSVHTPCTLRNVLKQPDAALKLLSRLPGVTVEPLPGNTRCCGAAGSYFVTKPDMADALLAPKIDAITGDNPDVVCTSNIGCAMHLNGGLLRAGSAIQTRHAITLMAARLRAAPEKGGD